MMTLSAVDEQDLEGMAGQGLDEQISPNVASRPYPLQGFLVAGGLLDENGNVIDGAYTHLGLGRQRWSRMRHRGAVTWAEADLLAVAIGMLPQDIWPEWEQDMSWYRRPVHTSTRGRESGGSLRRGIVDDKYIDDLSDVVLVGEQMRLFPLPPVTRESAAVALEPCGVDAAQGAQAAIVQPRLVRCA